MHTCLKLKDTWIDFIQYNFFVFKSWSTCSCELSESRNVSNFATNSVSMWRVSDFHQLKERMPFFQAGAKHKSDSPCCSPKQLPNVPLWIQSRPGIWSCWTCSAQTCDTSKPFWLFTFRCTHNTLGWLSTLRLAANPLQVTIALSRAPFHLIRPLRNQEQEHRIAITQQRKNSVDDPLEVRISWSQTSQDRSLTGTVAETIRKCVPNSLSRGCSSLSNRAKKVPRI